MNTGRKLLSASGMRGTFALLPALMMLALAAGCGKSAQERQEEYHRQTTALNSFDVQAVLAGRDPAATLEAALSSGGCVWLSKGIFSASENRSVVLGATYTPETNRLLLEQYSEYNWGLGKVHRTTSVVSIPVENLNAFVRPPTHSGPYRCWTLYMSCPDDGCVRYEQRYQLIGSDSVSDEGGKTGELTTWTLKYSSREAAIEACAALRALAERDS